LAALRLGMDIIMLALSWLYRTKALMYYLILTLGSLRQHLALRNESTAFVAEPNKIISLLLPRGGGERKPIID